MEDKKKEFLKEKLEDLKKKGKGEEKEEEEGEEEEEEEGKGGPFKKFKNLKK